MSKSNVDYLRDILQELDDIRTFTTDGEAAFMQDVKTQKAVIRSYEVIGEICKRLPDELRTAHPHIDWRKLINFRDFLAHNYEIIALRFVWDAVEDLANLRAAIEEILLKVSPGEDDSAEG
ncbi:MAG: DUF86 domain-containing protein [Anaerolineae bacterium]|nr:DUF86 domain-containing protein [Anaerolineae bacterium]